MIPRSDIAKVMSLLAAVSVIGLLFLWLNKDLTPRNIHWQSPASQHMEFQAMLESVRLPESGQHNESNALLVIQERPLFIVGRRPPPPPAPKNVGEQLLESSKVWDKVALLGTFEGKVSGIIFRANGKDQRLIKGQSFEGWVLTSVQPRLAEFTQAGKKRVLNLQKIDFTNVKEPRRAARQRAEVRRQPAPSMPVAPAVASPKLAEPEQATFGGTAAKAQ